MASEVVSLEQQLLFTKADKLRLEKQLEPSSSKADRLDKLYTSLSKEHAALVQRHEAAEEERRLLLGKLRQAEARLAMVVERAPGGIEQLLAAADSAAGRQVSEAGVQCELAGQPGAQVAEVGVQAGAEQPGVLLGAAPHATEAQRQQLLQQQAEAEGAGQGQADGGPQSPDSITSHVRQGPGGRLRARPSWAALPASTHQGRSPGPCESPLGCSPSHLPACWLPARQPPAPPPPPFAAVSPGQAISATSTGIATKLLARATTTSTPAASEPPPRPLPLDLPPMPCQPMLMPRPSRTAGPAHPGSPRLGSPPVPLPLLQPPSPSWRRCWTSSAAGCPRQWRRARRARRPHRWRWWRARRRGWCRPSACC